MTSYDVEFCYSTAELHALFATSRRCDVESGGRYDAGAAAINIWSHPWGHANLRYESTLIGALSVHWAARPRIWRLDCEEGFSRDDILHELAILEEEGLGHLKHGKRRSPSRDPGNPPATGRSR